MTQTNQPNCSCDCHTELNGIYCMECFELHENEWLFNSDKTIRARSRWKGKCNMPRDDCSPCELSEGHKGLHKHGFFVYDDTGAVD